MDEKTPAGDTKQSATAQTTSAPATEKPQTPDVTSAGEGPHATTAAQGSSTSTPTQSQQNDTTIKKSSPIGKLFVILFILVDLALAGYILYRMMTPQG
jgi:hypothetical protein